MASSISRRTSVVHNAQGGDRPQHAYQYNERHHPNFEKPIPIISSPSLAKPSHDEFRGDDPMDVSPAGPSPMGPPPLHTSASLKPTLGAPTTAARDSTSNGNTSIPTGAAAATQQPKVVQTAFIHKLYKCVQCLVWSLASQLIRRISMLEDQSIQHLISWSNTNESFLISPSSEFSKVLSYVQRSNSVLQTD